MNFLVAEIFRHGLGGDVLDLAGQELVPLQLEAAQVVGKEQLAAGIEQPQALADEPRMVGLDV